ncbi:helix-turn-helix domain-containing protein [Sodaliphilus pleomorphus]|uniref:Helix-turn-helix transcriptional regulator n=1 Tax=Sodaliphilus pleomorphus TaxID=2606626 RepID=A0A6L5XAZ4_9BACT|nr:helix-turn-helix transcriptional regulator [Sodaliphilus pleomorphus]MSS16176.1 helix-turn-helix transcriptional regulator [Sodaliphilus pleomorphus]
MKINEKIKSLRLERGMSIRQLADATGVSKTTIVNIEQGYNSASIELVQRLLDHLGYELSITTKRERPAQ